MIGRLLSRWRPGGAAPAPFAQIRPNATRVLVIGTSHVAALRGGWRRIERRHPDVTVDFFAVSRAYFPAFELREGRRYGVFAKREARAVAARETLRTLGMPDQVDLADWDVVLLAGQHSPCRRVASLLLAYDIDGLRETGAKARLSAAAFLKVCDGLAERCLPAPAWRGWTAPRLVYAPSPMKALSRADAATRGGWEMIEQRPEGFAAASRVMFDRVERLLARDGIGLLRQPPETIAASGATRGRYTRGSTALSGRGRHARTDRVHMNDAYGALCMEALVASLPRPSDAAAPRGR